MNDEEFRFLAQLLPELEEHLNILPGDALPGFDPEPLLLMARQAETGDIRLVLQNIAALDRQKSAVPLEHLVKAYTAVIQLRVLVNLKKMNFDADVQRALGREYQTEIQQCRSKLALTETGGSDPVDNETSENRRRQKYSAILQSLEQDLQSLTKRYGKESVLGRRRPDRKAKDHISFDSRYQTPKEPDFEHQEQRSESMPPKELPAVREPAAEAKDTIDTVQKDGKNRWIKWSLFRIRKKKKSEKVPVEAHTPDVRKNMVEEKNDTDGKNETEQKSLPMLTEPTTRRWAIEAEPETQYTSRTAVLERPYPERRLKFRTMTPCWLIPAFCILTGNSGWYFGLTKNAGKHLYRNDDHSLYHLEAADEELIQFLTVNILSGEYEVKRFDQQEKMALKNYFSFLTGLFTWELGKNLSIQDYLKFQEYYNRVSLRMYEQEQVFLKVQYQAQELAHSYQLLVCAYDLPESKELREIMEDLMNGDNGEYVERLCVIRDRYTVNPEFQTFMDRRIRELKDFQKQIPDTLEEMKNGKTEVIEYQDEALQILPTLHQNTELEGMYQDLIRNTPGKVMIRVQGEDTGTAKEGADYAFSNVLQAVYDYLYLPKDRRYLILVLGTTAYDLYAGNRTSAGLSLVTMETKTRFASETGLDPQLIDQYETFLLQVMQWIMEVES